jgi:hypothetical protein
MHFYGNENWSSASDALIVNAAQEQNWRNWMNNARRQRLSVTYRGSPALHARVPFYNNIARISVEPTADIVVMNGARGMGGLVDQRPDGQNEFLRRIKINVEYTHNMGEAPFIREDIVRLYDLGQTRSRIYTNIYGTGASQTDYPGSTPTGFDFTVSGSSPVINQGGQDGWLRNNRTRNVQVNVWGIWPVQDNNLRPVGSARRVNFPIGMIGYFN